jgi:hypothetical protein
METWRSSHENPAIIAFPARRRRGYSAMEHRCPVTKGRIFSDFYAYGIDDRLRMAP